MWPDVITKYFRSSEAKNLTLVAGIQKLFLQIYTLKNNQNHGLLAGVSGWDDSFW